MDVSAWNVCANCKGIAAALPYTRGWQKMIPMAEIGVMHMVTHFVCTESGLRLDYTQTHRQWPTA